MSFGEIIIDWYHKNKRDLPWRRTTDPYKIWLSEIILQQTRVEQGMAYYKRFVSAFPNVKKLATANESEVLKLWQGLGYYSRARNLHHAAKDVTKRFKGNFPVEYKDILSLKGIGEYTAAAISSFAFKQRYAVVDGNVFRVMSRYLGIKTAVNSSQAKKEFYDGAMELMSGQSPEIFNQAIMEFGALQCKPANPSCEICPLARSCYAYSKKMVGVLPVKDKKAKARSRYFNYLLIHNNGRVRLRKRTGNDIWKNMYDFPLIETKGKTSAKKLMEHEDWKKYFSEGKFQLVSESKMIKHQLTHQTIFAKFFKVDTKAVIRGSGIKSVPRNQVGKYAVPRLIENYINSSEWAGENG